MHEHSSQKCPTKLPYPWDMLRNYLCSSQLQGLFSDQRTQTNADWGSYGKFDRCMVIRFSKKWASMNEIIPLELVSHFKCVHHDTNCNLAHREAERKLHARLRGELQPSVGQTAHFRKIPQNESQRCSPTSARWCIAYFFTLYTPVLFIFLSDDAHRRSWGVNWKRWLFLVDGSAHISGNTEPNRTVQTRYESCSALRAELRWSLTASSKVASSIFF